MHLMEDVWKKIFMRWDSCPKMSSALDREAKMNKNDEFKREKEAHRKYIARKRRRRSGILAGVIVITVIAVAGFLLKDRFFHQKGNVKA